MSFAVILNRAVVVEQFGRTPLEPDPTHGVGASLTLQISPTSRANVVLELFHATMYVAIEAWRRFKFENEEVDALLQNENLVGDLRAHRDHVFHPGTVGEPPTIFKIEQVDVVTPWLGTLFLAMIADSRRWWLAYTELSTLDELKQFFDRTHTSQA